jgi:hypothetical protein
MALNEKDEDFESCPDSDDDNNNNNDGEIENIN